MNHAQRLILEYACENAHNQKTIDALDAIYARMIVTPIQRVWRTNPHRVVPALKKSWVGRRRYLSD
jgi:hypothetical protein